jgi:hypothetical protein
MVNKIGLSPVHATLALAENHARSAILPSIGQNVLDKVQTQSTNGAPLSLLVGYFVGPSRDGIEDVLPENNNLPHTQVGAVETSVARSLARRGPKVSRQARDPIHSCGRENIL